MFALLLQAVNMLVSSFFFLKNNYKTKTIYSSCRASKWQFPLALTELPLVNTSGRVQFSSPRRAGVHFFIFPMGWYVGENNRNPNLVWEKYCYLDSGVLTWYCHTQGTLTLLQIKKKVVPKSLTVWLMNIIVRLQIYYYFTFLQF